MFLSWSRVLELGLDLVSVGTARLDAVELLGVAEPPTEDVEAPRAVLTVECNSTHDDILREGKYRRHLEDRAPWYIK